MAKTIKQIADELGVSKTAVRKKIENLGLSGKMQTSGNRFLVDEEQESLIKSSFLKNETQTRKPETVCENREVSDLVSVLQSELEVKNGQLREKDRQLAAKDEQLAAKDEQIAALNQMLSNSQKLLDQQQQLSAIAEQKIQLLEQKTEENLQKTVSDLDTGEEQGKHWWQFWK